MTCSPTRSSLPVSHLHSLRGATTAALATDQPLESVGEHAFKDFPDPREVYHLVVDGVGADQFAPPRSLGRSRNRLPAVAGLLIGRASEVEALVRTLQGQDRVVTLTGPTR